MRTVVWIVTTVMAADPARGVFWEALALGVVVLSPRILTVRVAVRDLSRVIRRAARRRRSAAPLESTVDNVGG